MDGFLQKGSLVAGALSLLAGLVSYVVLVMGSASNGGGQSSLFFICFGWCMASLFFFNLPGLIRRFTQRRKRQD